MPERTGTRQFAVEQIDRLLGQLAFQISRTLRSHDAGSVHNLRSAIRRFTRALVVFKPCFPAKDVRKMRRRMEEIMVPARAVRNCDLAIHLLSQSKLPATATLRLSLARQRKDTERILLGTLKRWMERKSSLKWRTKLQGALESRKMALPETAEDVAAGILPDLAKSFFDRGKDAVESGGSADAIHPFRVAAKRLRYTLELFADLYGPGLNTWLDEIRTIHILSGDIDDCTAMRKTIEPGSEAVDAELRNWQQRRIEEFLREWTAVFADPGQTRHCTHYLRNAGQMSKKPIAVAAGSGQASRRA